MLEVTKNKVSGNSIHLLAFFGVAYVVFLNFYTAITILPMYTLFLGGSEMTAGIQSVLFYLAAIVMRFYFGPMTDRLGRKAPLLVGAIAFGTAPFFFLISDNLWMLGLARIYQAIGLAAFLSSGSSFVADMAPAEKMGRYIGAYRLVNTLALLSGPPLAMAIINHSGYDLWFKVAFAAGAVAVILMTVIKTPPVDKWEHSGSLTSFKAVLTNINLRPAFFSIALISISYGVLLTFTSLYISRVTQVVNPGFYFTYFGVAAIAANLAVGFLSDRFGRAAVLLPELVLMGLGTAILFFLPLSAMILIVSSILAGFGFGGALLTSIAWLVDLADKRMRGTVLAVQESTIDCFFGIGSFIFGVAADWIGMGLSFAVTGAAIMIAALLLLRNLKQSTVKQSLRSLN
ncbi:MFS transporter [Metallumcola ferriviriculae]|uniref:MFS transporter n=1 Tax=Metallumcola ferriviriculae TaxID=3039180 RepID=A0AAU0UNS9_9FIRM|nr:MFS transporter [Desulfitibacteraceae bacterium MK1]